MVEAAQVVADLTMTGLLALPEPHTTPESELAPVVALHPGSEPADPAWRFDGTDAGEPDPVAAPEPDAAAQAVSSELLAEFGALLRDEPEPALIDVEVLAEMEALAEVAASAEPAPEPATRTDTRASARASARADRPGRPSPRGRVSTRGVGTAAHGRGLQRRGSARRTQHGHNPAR